MVAVTCSERRTRSEERRVGKECRSRWSPYQQKEKSGTDAVPHQWKEADAPLSARRPQRRAGGGRSPPDRWPWPHRATAIALPLSLFAFSTVLLASLLFLRASGSRCR